MRRTSKRGRLYAAELVQLAALVDASDTATVAAAAGVTEATITTLLGGGSVLLGDVALVRAYLAAQ